eukprot:763619-Hanusia_phi.AAC.2
MPLQEFDYGHARFGGSLATWQRGWGKEKPLTPRTRKKKIAVVGIWQSNACTRDVCIGKATG